MAAEEPPAKRARVHFGAGEEAENKKVGQTSSSTGGSIVTGNGAISEAVLAGIRAGNINIADGAHHLDTHVLVTYTNVWAIVSRV